MALWDSKNSIVLVKALTYEEACLFGMGSMCMYPLSTDTRMYSLPLRERTGRRPVRSEWLVCDMGMTRRKALLESLKLGS